MVGVKTPVFQFGASYIGRGQIMGFLGASFRMKQCIGIDSRCLGGRHITRYSAYCRHHEPGHAETNGIMRSDAHQHAPQWPA